MLVSSGNLESDVNINLDFLDDKDESLPKEKINIDENSQKNNQKVTSSLFNSNIQTKIPCAQLVQNPNFGNLITNNGQFSNKRTFFNTNLMTQNEDQSNMYKVDQSKFKLKIIIYFYNKILDNPLLMKVISSDSFPKKKSKKKKLK